MTLNPRHHAFRVIGATFRLISDMPQDLPPRTTPDLEFPAPMVELKSWRGTVDPAASLTFSETQLARYWSDPEFVRHRREQRVNVPFEL